MKKAHLQPGNDSIDHGIEKAMPIKIETAGVERKPNSVPAREAVAVICLTP